MVAPKKSVTVIRPEKPAHGGETVEVSCALILIGDLQPTPEGSLPAVLYEVDASPREVAAMLAALKALGWLGLA